MAETKMLEDAPDTCAGPYDASQYWDQFKTFYFHKADGKCEPTQLSILKLACLFSVFSISSRWSIGEFLADLFPWLSPKALPERLRIAVCLASFLYMDFASGVIHLILDYAPFDLPGLGVLAKGFEFHHHDPTAIIRISW